MLNIKYDNWRIEYKSRRSLQYLSFFFLNILHCIENNNCKQSFQIIDLSSIILQCKMQQNSISPYIYEARNKNFHDISQRLYPIEYSRSIRVFQQLVMETGDSEISGQKKKKKKESNDRQNVGWNIVVAFTRLVDNHACRTRYREKRPSREREPWKIAPSLARDARVTIVVPESTLHLILISRTYNIYALLPVPSCVTRI